MLHAHPPEMQCNSHCIPQFPSGSAESSLPAESAGWEQLLLQRLLKQSNSGEIGDMLPLNNSENGAVGDTSQLSQLAITNLLLLQLVNQRLGEQPRVLSGDVPGEVSNKPVNTIASNLSGPDSFPLSHGSTVNQIDRRPPVPHHLVGAPADRLKLVRQDACQSAHGSYYTGLYIDQSSEPMGTETMATTKPAQGILITDAVEAVLQHWAETDALKEKSLQKFTSLLRRYATFATNLDAPSLAEQSEELAAKWIQAKGHDRSGNIVAPALATMGTRRAALRKFFRDAETLQLSDKGLFVRVHINPRPVGLARPLREEEADAVWLHAKDAGPSARRPVVFALLFAGLHSSEVGHITVSDFDIANQRVWAHGDTDRITPRWVTISEPYWTAVAERINYLRDWMPPHRVLETFKVAQGTSSTPISSPQSRVAAACAEVFRMAGLHKNPDITPSSVSLYSGSRMLIDGERIETIAEALGYSSLDSCAKALGYNWKTGEIG